MKARPKRGRTTLQTAKEDRKEAHSHKRERGARLLLLLGPALWNLPLDEAHALCSLLSPARSTLLPLFAQSARVEGQRVHREGAETRQRGAGSHCGVACFAPLFDSFFGPFP